MSNIKDLIFLLTLLLGIYNVMYPIINNIYMYNINYSELDEYYDIDKYFLGISISYDYHFFVGIICLIISYYLNNTN